MGFVPFLFVIPAKAGMTPFIYFTAGVIIYRIDYFKGREEIPSFFCYQSLLVLKLEQRCFLLQKTTVPAASPNRQKDFFAPLSFACGIIPPTLRTSRSSFLVGVIKILVSQ